MIPISVLHVVIWSVLAIWALSAVALFVEYQWHQRKGARAADLMGRLTASGSFLDDSLPELSCAEFQDLVLTGLPHLVEVALAKSLRTREGDEELLAIAIDGSLDERIQALHVIASGLHPERHAVLATALRAGQAEVAAIALRLLRGLDDDQASRTLIEALAGEVYSASRIAAALDRMTAEKAAFLGPLLQHASATVRFWGLLLAGRCGASQWTAKVRVLLTDREPTVRRAALEAIGRLGSDEDRPAIVSRFYDPSPMVRVHAARAARTVGNAGVAEALVTLLTDREWIVRAAARDSLRVMGEVATPAVLRAVWYGDAFAANNAAEVLFMTGETVRGIEALIDQPENLARRRLVERLMAVSGPQIVRAIDDQLDAAQRSTLRRVIGDTAAVLEPVRKR